MLKSFLEKKPLYYDEIDYTRMPRVYNKIQAQLPKVKIIHLIGTNGKGTTGRFLASALYARGFSVGHYTSPHILEFNERIWINNNNISDDMLDGAHEELQKMLSKEDANSLSYFEYTTFVAMLLFRGCDYVVLEAGLGGEHDATAVFEKELTLVTPIDIDHEAFLGSTIREIAQTKLNAIQKNAIIAPQKYKEVGQIALTMGEDKNIYQTKDLLSQDDFQKIEQISSTLHLAEYLQQNLMLSIAALKFLKVEYGVEDFYNAKLFGRLSYIGENIIVDVGHNTLAASSVQNALKGKKYILVYNSYKDKNYREILSILKPLIKHVEIIDVYDVRVESQEILKQTLTELSIDFCRFEGVKEDAKYLVFGSFSVVEAFLNTLAKSVYE